MNKKGTGVIGAIILFFLFLIIWLVWLSSWINEVGQIALDNGATGLEAFFYSYLNLWVFTIMLLAVMGWMYFGGGE